MKILNKLLLGICNLSTKNILYLDFHYILFLSIGIFSPYRRADLSTNTSLPRVRSSLLQLHSRRLVFVLTSVRV